MTNPDRETPGELPVGIAEVFRWRSWRTWSIFFGVALVNGGLGAILAAIVKILEFRSTGILEGLAMVIPAMVIAYLVLVQLSRRLVAVFWGADMLNQDIVGRPNVRIGFRDRQDYMLALLWLCCLAGAFVLAGQLLIDLAAVDQAIVEDGIGIVAVLSMLVVLRSWEQVLNAILTRCTRSVS